MALLESPVAPPVLPGLDLADIDDKLRHMGAVESSWGLPPLPDEVKLDLVTQQDKDGLGEFLYGLASDLNRLLNPLAAEPAAAAPLVDPGTSLASPLAPPEPATYQAAGVLTDIAGYPRPQVVDPNAVVEWKRKAISMGLLPADSILDTRCDPALNPSPPRCGTRTSGGG